MVILLSKFDFPHIKIMSNAMDLIMFVDNCGVFPLSLR